MKTTDWDEGYRKALEDVYDALHNQQMDGVWWHIKAEIPHESANGVARDEQPEWVTW